MEENLNIPPEAIRTMKKDMMGITQNEWDLNLAKSEIDALLKKLEENKLKHEQEIERIGKKKPEHKLEPKKEETKKEKIITVEIKKEEPKPQPQPEPKQEDKEEEIVAEIKKRALEREEMVKKETEGTKDKKSLIDETRDEKDSEIHKERGLLKKLEELKRELSVLPAERKPLQESETYYKQQLAKIMKDLEPVLESEKKIEENIKFIEGIEKTAITPRQKKKAEQERQLAEQEREVIEKQRWDYEQKRFQNEKQLKEIEFGFQQISQKEAKIKQEMERINRELEKIDRAKEKKEIDLKIQALVKEKQQYNKLKEEILEKRKDVEERLAEAMNKEQKVEQELGYVHSEEKLATDTEKQKIEKKRWALEKDRSDLEKNRWDIEEEKRKIRLEENRINVHYQKILEKENELRKRIEDINRLLGLSVPKEPELPPKPQEQQETPTQKPIEEENPQEMEAVTSGRPKVELETQEAIKKGIGPTKKTQPAQEEKLNPEKEKAKAELDKIEAKKRKEELLKKLRMQREQDIKEKEQMLMRRIRQDNPEQPQNAEPVPQAPITGPSIPKMDVQGGKSNLGKLKKWIIIAGLSVIILGVILFFYYMFKVRNQEPEALPPVIEEPEVEEPEIEEPIVLDIPESLISENLIHSTIPFDLNDINGLGSILDLLYNNKDIQTDVFNRILFKDEVHYFTLSEITEQMQLLMPEDLAIQLKHDATFFMFPTEEYNTLGFIAEIDDTLGYTENTLEITFDSWSSELINGMNNFGSIIGETDLGLTDIEENNYQNQTLRYATLKPGCYGVCYSIFNNKLHFATCCDPIIKLIDTQND